jgi:hypothetical protein
LCRAIHETGGFHARRRGPPPAALPVQNIRRPRHGIFCRIEFDYPISTDRYAWSALTAVPKQDCIAPGTPGILGASMNIEKVIFSFFIVLALTLNFGFFLGESDNPNHHNVYEFFAVLVVNLIATVLKFGERTQMGAVLLATSLVADLELIAAAFVWTYATNISGMGVTPEVMGTIISLAGGALVANIVSVVLLVIEISATRR